MNILVVGGGEARALAWKIAQPASRVFVAPGNGGAVREPALANAALSAIISSSNSHQSVTSRSRSSVRRRRLRPASSTPSCRGTVDFRPDARGGAARAQGFRQGVHGAPWPADRRLSHFTDARAARLCSGRGAPIVVKADGLAAGKGVVVRDARGSDAAIDAMLVENALGPRGARVIEDFLAGEEAASSRWSMARMSSSPRLGSQRLRDGDQGQHRRHGRYSPAPVVTPVVHARIMREVINSGRQRQLRRHPLHGIPQPA